MMLWQKAKLYLGEHKAHLFLALIPIVLLFGYYIHWAIAVLFLVGVASTGAQRYVRWSYLIICATYLLLSFDYKSADFFLGILLLTLPLIEWRQERPSPLYLTAVSFLAAGVFIYSQQFFTLVLVGLWLLMFLIIYIWIAYDYDLSKIRLRLSWLFGMGFLAGFMVLILFISLPRLQMGLLPTFQVGAERQTGLTDQLEIDHFAKLIQDRTEAFRASGQALQDWTSKDLYWRVYVLDEDQAQGRWVRGSRTSQSLQLAPGSHNLDQLQAINYEVAWAQKQKYLPVLGDVPTFKGLDYSLSVYGEAQMNRPGQTSIPMGAYSSAQHRLWPETTQLQSAPEMRTWALAQRQRYASDTAYANFVFEYLQKNFSYDLNATAKSVSGDTLDHFFFRTQRGYCTHFALAYATLLRAVGIPAHVVVGFHGGEFNPYGSYWIVRNSHAHAWVEARIEKSWQRIDPTPSLTSNVSISAYQSVESWRNVNVFDLPLYWFKQSYYFFDYLNLSLSQTISRYGYDRAAQSWGGGPWNYLRDHIDLIWTILFLVVMLGLGFYLMRFYWRYLRIETYYEFCLRPWIGGRSPYETYAAYTQRALALARPEDHERIHRAYEQLERYLFSGQDLDARQVRQKIRNLLSADDTLEWKGSRQKLN